MHFNILSHVFIIVFLVGGSSMTTAPWSQSTHALMPPLANLFLTLLFGNPPLAILTMRWQGHRDQILIGPIPAHNPTLNLRCLFSPRAPAACKAT